MTMISKYIDTWVVPDKSICSRYLHRLSDCERMSNSKEPCVSYTYIYGALRQVLNKQLLSEPCQQLVIIKVTDTSVIVILKLIKS